jgi:hypothetical protein
MRIAVLAVVVALAAACGPRRVQVGTSPSGGGGGGGGGGGTTASPVAVQVTNNLSQAVNVYVSSGGTDTFLRQVKGNSVETVPVQGFTSGTSVTIKAVTVDGVQTFSRPNVVLSGTYSFAVP